MGNKKRLRKNKQQSMGRRLKGGKKPMSNEQKAEQKKQKEAQKQRQKNLDESNKSE